MVEAAQGPYTYEPDVTSASSYAYLMSQTGCIGEVYGDFKENRDATGNLLAASWDLLQAAEVVIQGWEDEDISRHSIRALALAVFKAKGVA